MKPSRPHAESYTGYLKLAIYFQYWLATICGVTDWSFLTNHARALLFIASDPNARLRDLADAIAVTERTAYGIVVDLAEAGYVVKEKDGRRNRYHIQTDLPLRDPISTERTIGEVLDLLVDAKRPSPLHQPGPADRDRRAARSTSKTN